MIPLADRLRGLAAKLRAMLGRRAAEARMEDEFRFHLEMETEKQRRAGLPPDEARRRALLAFGGAERWREDMRDGRGARWAEDLAADVRYAARTLRRSPGFALAAALTVALGVGLNGIVFGFVNGLLIRPVPATHPEQLVALFNTDRRGDGAHSLGYEDYLDFRDRSGAFAGLAAQTGIPLSLHAGEVADVVWGEMVTENFFAVLAMRPALGRFFTPEDAAPGSNPLAVLSHDSWRRRFGGDPTVVGREVRINGHRFTIAGVAPKGFRGLRKFGFWAEMWVPAAMHEALVPGSTNMLRGRGSGWAITVGRMHPGWTPERTEAAAATFARALERAYPASNRDKGIVVVPAKTGFENPSFVEPRMMVLISSLALFAVTLVLLVICANLANLLLARAAARRRELAIRLSLGCSRGRLVRQMLTEALVLALPGALLGLGLVFASPAMERAMLPALQFQVGVSGGPDWRVVLYTAGVALVAALLFGVAPALRAARPQLVPALKAVVGEEPGRARGGLAGALGLRGLLVVGQLALSVVLVTGGALFARSLLAARAVDVRFDPRDRIAVSVNPGLQGYDEARGRALYRDVLARIRATPGVASASWGFPTPFDTYGRTLRLYVEGAASAAERQTVGVQSSVVDQGFLATLGVPLAAGRDFSHADSVGAPLGMIVSRSAAARLWPGREPVGQRARLWRADGEEITVVGVAEDARFTSLDGGPESRVYLPLGQHYRDGLTLVVHRPGDESRAFRDARDAVAAVDPALPTYGASTMRRAVENALSNAVTAASFAGVFGLVALLIAVIGLYALVAGVVAERTREIGVRIALGATRASVLRLVVGRAGRLGAIGLVMGIAGAAAVARLLGGLLYGLSPHDPLTFTVVPLALAAVVLAASWIPARRATRMDPVVALRSE